MKNGASRAVLVSELLTHDGPYSMVADDYVYSRCSHCRDDVGDDVQFLAAGFLCGACARLLPGV